MYTNKTPVGAYRGAGRPEATYLVERIVDVVADELKLDPADVRRKNFIRPDEFPYKTPMGTSYDTGDYVPALDRLLAMAGYDELRRKQAASRGDPSKPLIGIGISGYLEICAFGPWESATVRVEKSGKVTLAGRHLAARSGPRDAVPPDRRRPARHPVGRHSRRCSTTPLVVPTGIGTFGSRSAAIGGSAVLGASERVRDKVIRLAADALEAAPEDVEIEPRPDQRARRARSFDDARRPRRRAPTTARSPTATSPAWKPIASSSPRARRSRSACTWPSSRSIATRARCDWCATWRWTTAGAC